MAKPNFVYVLDHVLSVYRTSAALFRENCEPAYTDWRELVDGELWTGIYHDSDKRMVNVTVRRRQVRG